jgi:hypothetical protein
VGDVDEGVVGDDESGHDGSSGFMRSIVMEV